MFYPAFRQGQQARTLPLERNKRTGLLILSSVFQGKSKFLVLRFESGTRGLVSSIKNGFIPLGFVKNHLFIPLCFVKNNHIIPLGFSKI